LNIGSQLAVDQEKQWNAWSMGRGFGGGMGSATNSTISNGTLVLDLYDPGTEPLVWKGALPKHQTPVPITKKHENAEQIYGQTVEKIPAEAETTTGLLTVLTCLKRQLRRRRPMRTLIRVERHQAEPEYGNDQDHHQASYSKRFVLPAYHRRIFI
jgi:hypothetical protein